MVSQWIVLRYPEFELNFNGIAGRTVQNGDSDHGSNVSRGPLRMHMANRPGNLGAGREISGGSREAEGAGSVRRTLRHFTQPRARTEPARMAREVLPHANAPSRT